MILRIDLLRPLLRRRAFTLVELMISIALVLILLVGINQVFKMTTDTVGAGQAINAASRDLRGAQSVFFNDLHGAVTSNPPAFIIRSEQTTAFRNRADELGDRDYAAAAATATSSVSASNTAAMEEKIRTIDLDNDGTEGEIGVPGEIISPALYGDRSHRTDKLIFFARGYFPRQTGNDGYFAANMSSNEAYIWYGQVKLPNNAADLTDTNNYRSLGADFGRALASSQAPWTTTTNPNNFYASQWVLGREVILLRELDSSGHIRDNDNIIQHYSSGNGSGGASLSPLNVGSNIDNDASLYFQYSRYDLASTSIDGFRNIVTAYINKVPPNAQEWWYTFSNWRFQASQYYMRPLNSYGVARTVPLFMNNCSQFIVEYAGDFVTQNDNPSDTANYGSVTNVVPDGRTDFVVFNGVAKTRWYGLPRDVNGDGIIQGYKSGIKNNDLQDVVPLRDVRLTSSTAPNPATGEAPFERSVNFWIPLPTASSGRYDELSGGMVVGSQYIVAWGPDTTGQPLPKMIRIVATVDDPAGRMATGQTMEYVIDLP